MEQLLLSRQQVAEALCISVDTLDRLAACGQIQRLKIGAKTCYHKSEVHNFAARLSHTGAIALRR